MSFGNITVDLLNRQVNRDGQALHLTPIEFRLLATLLASPGKVLTPRQKLESDPARPRHLLTETAIGYRFMP